TWPLRGSGSWRDECPCPRQSIIATAKPRSRKSRTVSKYFSICSPRPVNRQTVPLRPCGDGHRAKRKSTPSEVLTAPLTQFSGTGFAGIESSFMTNRLEEKPERADRLTAAVSRLLNVPELPPYHFRAGR